MSVIGAGSTGENPKEHLLRARREGWAMSSFNIFNLESARASSTRGTN
jgi:fructose/tagatose bisphosphate aldolase